MVTFLCLPAGAGHINGLSRAYGPQYTRRLTELTYHELLQGRKVALGAFVFLDCERMSLRQRRIAVQIAGRLRALAPRIRIFNDPAKQLGRYELLSLLADEKINDYGAYRLREAGRARLPAFIRVESDHRGPRTGIIETPAELDREIRRLLIQGLDPDDLIVVEFLSVADEAGIYRRYGALRIGPMVSCNHVYLSRNWMGKWDTAIVDEETRDESEAYFLDNLHAEMLMPIFDKAGIQYGRLDYGMLDGRPQVWEINDNPQYGPGQSSAFHRLERHKRWALGFESLDEGIEDGPEIQILARDLDLAGALSA